jgi:hypothetical protein
MLQVEEKRGAPNIYINILNNHISKKTGWLLEGKRPTLHAVTYTEFNVGIYIYKYNYISLQCTMLLHIVQIPLAV